MYVCIYIYIYIYIYVYGPKKKTKKTLTVLRVCMFGFPQRRLYSKEGGKTATRAAFQAALSRFALCA